MSELNYGEMAKKMLARTGRTAVRFDLLFGYSAETARFRSVLAAAQIPALLYRKNGLRSAFPFVKTCFYDGYFWRDCENNYEKRNGNTTPLETGVMLASSAVPFSVSASGIVARGNEAPLYAFPSGIWHRDRMIPLWQCSDVFLAPGKYGVKGPVSGEGMTGILDLYMMDCALSASLYPKMYDDLLYSLYRMEVYLGERLPFPLPKKTADRVWAMAGANERLMDIREFSGLMGSGEYVIKPTEADFPDVR